MLGGLHPTRRKSEGKNMGRHLELSERRRVFAWEKRRGTRAVRKATRMKHKAARTRSRLDELTFGAPNVPTAAINGGHGISHIDTLLRPCVAKGCGVIGLQETKRNGTSEIVASGYRVHFSGDCSGAKAREGHHGLGLAIEEEIVKNAGKYGIVIEYISVFLLKARISIKISLRSW